MDSIICIWILFGSKEKQNHRICREIDGLRMYILSEVTQSQKQKMHILSHIWKLAYNTC